MWRCTFCGTENSNNSNFCMKCGGSKKCIEPKPKRDKTKYFLLAIIGVLSVALALAIFVIFRSASTSEAAPTPAPTKNTTYIQGALQTPASIATPAPKHEYMWTEWSSWSSDPVVSSSTREVETRANKTVIGYNMVHYGTQQAKDPHYRMFRDYSIGGEYSFYGARESYGEKHLTKYVTAREFYYATPYSGNGSWVSITYNGENYQGYQMSSSTAYNFGDDNKVWFIESEDYYTTTEYRYRDYIMVS